MLLDGVNHVAILTKDTEAFHAFFREVFDATVGGEDRMPGGRLTIVHIGGGREINLFEIDGNAEADRQTPMMARGRIDHIGLQAASQEAFDEIRDRLLARGATDGFVTDFGPALSVFFVGPDGLEGEVLTPVPDAPPDVLNQPGTPAAGYEIGVPGRST